MIKALALACLALAATIPAVAAPQSVVIAHREPAWILAITADMPKQSIAPLHFWTAPHKSGAYLVGSLETSLTAIPAFSQECGLWAFADTDEDDFDLEGCGPTDYALRLALDFELELDPLGYL